MVPSADYENIGAQYGRLFLWTTPQFYLPFRLFKVILVYKYFESIAGRFDEYLTVSGPVEIKVGIKFPDAREFGN
jgi:hypothetical protein